MEVVRGKTIEDVDLDALAAAFPRVHVDVGTGDGRYALHVARREPETLVVAIDAITENLEETARKAARQPRKGGTANVLYVHASAEAPPPDLHGRADAVTVILPWGRLMAGLLLPIADVLDGLHRLGHPGTAFRAVINAEVWGDPIPVEARDLPELTPERATGELAPRYRAHGIDVDDARMLDAAAVADLRSTWAKKLASSRALPRFVEITGRYL
ncbi:MAG TPA: class I SAM-dependent methyltransferase [Acidimicrobiales bacterium]|nr:class I SAM-dependent methyltransferase [Acidimicrobiales bacterium]